MQCEEWRGKHYAFFQNRECECFPCHKMADESQFNCLFCYCPLYALGSTCGGNFSYTDKGIKDCSGCSIPHLKDNYGRILEKCPELVELAKKKEEDIREVCTLNVLDLKKTAVQVRQGIIEGTYHARSGHPGGSLSSADMVTYLYFHRMNIDPARPLWEDRDRFVLSKGHCAPALYAVLALRGFFPLEELRTLRRIGSRLQGHPNMNLTPGVDMSTGSLGQGASVAAGMALGAKKAGKSLRVYALLGDGEIQEGQVWEAFMFSAHYKLDNFTVIIDNNNLQIDGEIDRVMSPYPIDEKMTAFGFDAQTVNGHDFQAIDAAFRHTDAVQGKPCAIIMKTVKGKGVSFMENRAAWHGKAPNEEEYRQAMSELNAALAELEVK